MLWIATPAFFASIVTASPTARRISVGSKKLSSMTTSISRLASLGVVAAPVVASAVAVPAGVASDEEPPPSSLHATVALRSAAPAMSAVHLLLIRISYLRLYCLRPATLTSAVVREPHRRSHFQVTKVPWSFGLNLFAS